MITKIYIYDIKHRYCNDDMNEVYGYKNAQVCVGFDPWKEWGDDESKWTEKQKEFDGNIKQYFDDMSQFKDFTTRYIAREVYESKWYIDSYEEHMSIIGANDSEELLDLYLIQKNMNFSLTE